MIQKPSAGNDDADMVELATAPPTPPPQALVPVESPAAGPVVGRGVASEDLFAQLSTALTTKMDPPPDPRVDLRLSTGLWLVTTAVGVGMWIYFSQHDSSRLTLIWFVAGLQIVLGLGLIVYRAGCRGPVAGVLALFPPVTVYRLFQSDGPDGYRPLRFVLTAAALAVLPILPLPSRAAVGNTLGLTEVAGTADRSAESAVVRLRRIVEKPGETEALREELKRLAADGRGSASDAEATQMIAEFRTLLKPGHASVQSDVVRALVAWDRDDARPDVVRLLQSPIRQDRATALSLLTTWPDAASAAAALGLLGSEEDQYPAKDTLLELGKSVPAVVETVALDALLHPPERNPAPPKPLLDVLEAVGGPAAVDGLKTYEAKMKSDPFLHDLAEKKRTAIEKRLAEKRPGKNGPSR